MTRVQSQKCKFKPILAACPLIHKVVNLIIDKLAKELTGVHPTRCFCACACATQRTRQNSVANRSTFMNMS